MSRFHFDDEAGYGLIELTMGLVLSALLLGIVYKVITTFDNIQSVTLSSQAATVNGDRASTALSRLLSEAVNTGTGSVISASPSSIQFDAISPDGQLGVESLTVAGGQCPCQITQSFSSASGTTAPENLGITTTQPNVFVYYSTPDTPGGLSQTQISIPAAGSSDPALVGQISLVKVSISENVADHGLSVSSTVIQLPNNSSSQQGGSS